MAMEPEPESEAAAQTAATVVVLPAAAVTVLPRKAVWTEPALAEFAAAPWAGKMPQSPPAQAPADCLKFRTMPSYGLWVVSRTLEDAGFVATSNDDRDFNLLWVARAVISTAISSSGCIIGVKCTCRGEFRLFFRLLFISSTH